MTVFFSDDFETNLGIIRMSAETDAYDYIIHKDNSKVSSKGHSIRVDKFDLKDISDTENIKYETSRAWRLHIEKINDQQEQLILYCKLINPQTDTSWGIHSGEHLDALEIENQTDHLHIGTEDGEMIQHRARVSDWMPGRLKDEDGSFKSFTEYVEFGFKTVVPLLENGEKIYFHFIVATNRIKPSIDYPNERDVSTWLAVDQSKNYLDRIR